MSSLTRLAPLVVSTVESQLPVIGSRLLRRGHSLDITQLEARRTGEAGWLQVRKGVAKVVVKIKRIQNSGCKYIIHDI